VEYSNGIGISTSFCWLLEYDNQKVPFVIVRCNAAECSYLALDMLEMKQHSDEHVDSVYWSFKDQDLEDSVANYCDFCNGHFKSAKHLEGHKLVSHNSSDTSNIDSLLVNTNEESLEDDEDIEEIF